MAIAALESGKPVKILCCCGAGMACCMMMAMKLEKICKRLDIPAHITHNNVAGGMPVASQYDVIFCSNKLVKNFDRAAQKGTLVIGLTNVTSDSEIEQKVHECILQDAETN